MASDLILQRNLWLPERQHYDAGTRDHAVFDTKEFGKVGLLIWCVAQGGAE